MDANNGENIYFAELEIPIFITRPSRMSASGSIEMQLKCLRNLVVHADAEDIETYLGQTAEIPQATPEKVSRLYAVMTHLLADLRGRPGSKVAIEDMVSLSGLEALLDMVRSGKIRQRTRSLVVDYLFSLPGMTSANLMLAHKMASRTVRAHEEVRLLALSHPLLQASARLVGTIQRAG